jgi:hypothetical protein
VACTCLTRLLFLAQAGEPSGFQRVLDALNVLGNTKWCVLICRPREAKAVIRAER